MPGQSSLQNPSSLPLQMLVLEKKQLFFSSVFSTFPSSSGKPRGGTGKGVCCSPRAESGSWASRHSFCVLREENKGNWKNPPSGQWPDLSLPAGCIIPCSPPQRSITPSFLSCHRSHPLPCARALPGQSVKDLVFRTLSRTASITSRKAPHYHCFSTPSAAPNRLWGLRVGMKKSERYY